MKEKYEWRASDLIIPILAVFLAFYYLITIRGLPLIAQMYGGSLSIFIIVLSVILFLLVIKNGALKKEKVNIFISEKI